MHTTADIDTGRNVQRLQSAADHILRANGCLPPDSFRAYELAFPSPSRSYPLHRNTGRRGYFGYAGSVLERLHR